MKKIQFLITFLLITFLDINAQIKTEASETHFYCQTITDISKYVNQEFKISVALRAENFMNNSLIFFYARTDDKDKQTIFFKNTAYEVSLDPNWKTYEIKGIIKENAVNLSFGCLASNKGDFYFDDFIVQIKNKKRKWETLKINNPSFEDKFGTDNWGSKSKKGIVYNPSNFNITYSNYNPYKGKSCLLIKGGDILGSSSKGKTVDVNGVSLYYEIYGEGEPLLLLHGNGQSISAFKEQVEEYAKHYKVIIVDCRGRGNSTYQDDVELTFEVEIEDLKQFLDKINIEKTHIVGWSDGGILGILMAIKHPEKVDKMVSMAGNIFPDGLVNKEELLDYVKQFQELNTKHQYDKMIDFLYLDYKYPNLEYEELKVIKSKCLIMAGDKDEIKTEHTVKIFENIPNAQLAIVPNATHYLPRDNPKLFNEIILRFLKEE